MDRTDSRLAPSPEPASDDAASPFNRPPRPPRDLLDFEPVPLRHRTGGLTPEKQREYVEALADTGLVREAAARVGVTEQAINRIRRRSDAREFDRACEAAHLMGARRLRSIAFERAIEGTLKGHYYRGERVGEERVYDNRLLMYLLGKTEHLLEPDAEARPVLDNWGACMDALEQGRNIDDAAELEAIGERQVWRTDEGEWRTSFPPPEGFDGYSEGDWDGISWYCRALTDQEQRAVEADQAAERIAACARRDRFFGFAGDDLSSPGEAETSETSEPSEAEAAVIPAKADTSGQDVSASLPEIPASAGMTMSHPAPSKAIPLTVPLAVGPAPPPANPATAVIPGQDVAACLSRIRRNGGSKRRRRRRRLAQNRISASPTSKPRSPGILEDEPPGVTP